MQRFRVTTFKVKGKNQMKGRIFSPTFNVSLCDSRDRSWHWWVLSSLNITSLVNHDDIRTWFLNSRQRKLIIHYLGQRQGRYEESERVSLSLGENLHTADVSEMAAVLYYYHMPYKVISAGSTSEHSYPLIKVKKIQILLVATLHSPNFIVSSE